MNNDNESASRDLHLCIATGQNAANLIPLEQYDVRDVWILQTPEMRQNASHLEIALRREGRTVRRIDFDDSTPAKMQAHAEELAQRLDGRHIVLHATGGTKLMVLAIRDGLRLVEAGSGSLDIVYADTNKQRIDWLGRAPRTDPMEDVLNLEHMLLVQGYRIAGDSRHRDAQRRAGARATLTRDLGENAGRYGRAFTALATLARSAADGGNPRDLTQLFQYPPGGHLAALLDRATQAGLMTWDRDVALTFPDRERAEYFAGGWIEEFALLKLTGLLKADRFSTNLQIQSAGNAVPNEIDAMVVHRNRALLIECKTGRQTRAQDKLYKLAQLRLKLGGSVASALYLSAQSLDEAAQKRAEEYRIDVLCGDDVAKLVPWLKDWLVK